MKRSPTTCHLVRILALLALIAVPAMADDVIYSGADLWITSQTYASFAVDPIPADFFCPGSPAFTGRIHFRGVPLATEPAGFLRDIDTIIHRLDNATFDEDGSASTRIRFLAISMAGEEPLEMAGCGLYDVTASLDGEQPTTEMKIYRTSESGGTFLAPLKLNVKMVFTPRASGESLALRRNIHLGPGTASVWSVVPMPQEYLHVTVDTNGDRVPDTIVPAPSNFAVGNIVPAAVTIPPAIPIDDEPCYSTTPAVPDCPDGTCLYQSCHCTPWSQSPDPFEPLDNCETDGNGDIDVCHLHCVYVCIPCELVDDAVGEEILIQL